jgi:hypothetical protein
MSLSRYLDAISPDRYAILGVVLNPFSVGHFLLLSKCGSPFVSEKAVSNVTLGKLAHAEIWQELVFAISVCRHTYEDFSAILNNPEELKNEVQLLNENISKTISILREKKEFDPLQIILLFREYLQDGFKVPAWSFKNSKTGGGTSSKHWSQQLIEDLVSKTHRSQSDVLNEHLAASWLAWSHIAEDAGVIELLSEEQAASVEHGQKTGDSGLIIEPGGWEKLLAYQKEKGGIGAMI